MPNALWIWTKLIDCLTSSQLDEGPKYVGEKIIEKFSESDMIEERPSMKELGFVTIKLSGKWIAKSIHKMLKDGIDTWAPKLPVEREKLDEAKSRCLVVSKGEAAKLLGYSAKAVLDCVFRLAVCTFDIKMSNEKGNTFLYLLNTQAQIRRITNEYRKDIIELEKASELILEKDKGWDKGEERELGFHLLEFTEALEESCLSGLPHILCEYLYELCKKFNGYHSSECKDGSFVETTTLLLYEATEVVMEKCFHLLGITPTVTSSLFGSSMTQLLSGLLFSAVERPIDVNPRDPTRNFRFEMVSFRARPRTPFWYAQEGELFGLISVSDKSVPSRCHFFEPDVTHVPLFNHDWRNPINIRDSGLVYLGNPGSGQPVSFSYFIEICTELYATNKNECYQLCNHKKEIDLSSFWDRKSDGECGELYVVAEHGTVEMNYILLKDAIDTSFRVKFEKKTGYSCSSSSWICTGLLW